MLKKITKILTLLVTVATSSITVMAASSDLPLQVEYSGLPGTSINGQISVLNTADKTHTITLSVDECPAESQVPSLTEWIVLPTTAFPVKAGEKVVIPYQINIPINASAQGYYGTIKVETTDEQGIMADQVVLLEVGENGDKEFFMQDLSINQNSLNIEIANKGSVHGTVEGLVEIIDTRGKVIEEMPLNDQGQNILPNNAVTYVEDSYAKNLPAGVYYLVIDGKADNGQQIQGKITFQTDRNGKIEIIDKYIGSVDIDSLRGSAQQQYVTLQTALAVAAILIFAIGFVAVGKYCIKGV